MSMVARAPSAHRRSQPQALPLLGAVLKLVVHGAEQAVDLVTPLCRTHTDTREHELMGRTVELQQVSGPAANERPAAP